MTVSDVEQDPREPLKRVLLPPLRFAAKNDYAGLARLKGFSQLVSRALTDSGSIDDRAMGNPELTAKQAGGAR